MMFHMKTASVRDLRQDFPRVLAWLHEGEKVAITLRRQAIATLVPCPKKKRVRRAMPDLTKRLQKVFGQRVIPDHTVAAILDQDRGTR
jgi:antitoxin (DNA-binding transcriptional repressor) of toxin-antitoxin stability system